MIPENERARRGKAPLYKTNAHEVPRAFRGEEEQQCATQTDKKPPTPYYLPCRRICQAQSSANEPPHHKRVRTDGAEVFLDLREGARGLAQTGDALRVHTPAAARDLRKNHEKAAVRKERREPERGVEAHKLAR